MSASSWQAVWLLAVEVAAVVGLTWLIAWRLRSVVWQRTLWQASLIAIVGLLVMEFTSLSRFRFTGQEEGKIPEAVISAEAWPMQPVVSVQDVAATELSITTEAAPVLELGPVVTEPAGEVVEVKAEAARMEPTASPVTLPQAQKESGFPLMLAIALGVWVVGSVVLAGRLLVGRFLLLRFCARSQSVFDVRLFDRVQDIAGKLGLKQGVQVLETERIQTPVVFGLVRLTIALPVGFAEKFERRQQEAILAHELAHLAARDPLWYLLADALVSVLWWHPLVWVARARLQVTSELAADEACVLAKHGPETLAECLVTIAKEMHGQGALESIGIEGSGFRSRLGQRVERLLQLSAEAVSRPAVWRTRLVKAGLPVVLVGVLLVTSGWARKEGALSWSDLQVQSWMVLSGLMEKPEISPPVKRERMLLAAATTAARPEESIPPSKLDAVKLPRMVFDKMPLNEVVSMLGKGVRELGQTVEFRLEGSIPVSSGAVELGLLEITAEIKEGSSLSEALNFVRIGAGFPLLLSEADGKVVIRAKETALKVPRPYVSKDGITSSLERAAVISRLNSITLPRVSFKNKTLGQVTASLQEEIALQLMLTKREANYIRFLLDRDFIESGLANLPISLDPPLVNKTALEVLMAVAEATPKEPGKGARFTVDNHAQAKWEWNVTEPPQLYSMGFGIDVPAFITGLEQSAGKKINVPADLTAEGRNLVEWISDSKELQDAMREFFAKKGAVFGAYTTNQAAKRIFLIGKTSILFVRASMTELDVIHSEIEKLKAQRVLPKVDEAKAKTTPTMFTTVFKFDPETFVRGAEKLTGKKASDLTNIRTTEAELVQTMARLLFASEGANMDASTEAGAQVQLNFMDRTGDFFVRAALEDREIILKAVEKAKAAGKIEVKTPDKAPAQSPSGKVSEGAKLPPPAAMGDKKIQAQAEELKTLKDKAQTSKLVQEGKLLYELKRLEEAEVKLREAMKLDPTNSAAYYYMNLIQEARYGDLARRRDNIVFPGGLPKARAELAIPNPYVRTNVAQTMTKARQRIEGKLDQMVIKEAFFDGLPLSELVRFLREESAKQDPDKVGINFVINSHLDGQPAGEGGKTLRDPLGAPLAPVVSPGPQGLNMVRVTINPPLKNLTMREMLGAITNATAQVGKHGLDYKVEDFGVTFRQRVIDPPLLFTRIFKIDAETFIKGLEKRAGKKVMALATNLVVSGGANLVWNPVMTNNALARTEQIQTMARQYFEEQGVSMKTNEQGSAITQVFFNDRTGVLMVRVTLEDLKVIQESEIIQNQAVVAPAEQPAGRLEQPKSELPGKTEADERIKKVFSVEPSQLAYWLREMGFMKETVQGIPNTNIQQALTRYLSKELHLAVNSNVANGVTAVWEADDKQVVVQGGLRDLEMIGSALEVLSIIPAQVQVEVRYIEVSDKAAKEMGLNWFTSGPLSGTNMVKADQFLNRTIPTNQNVRVEAPVLPNYVSVLSPAQAKALIKQFEQKAGIDLLTAPKVTTVSNREAMIAVEDHLEVMVGVETNQTTRVRKSGEKLEPSYVKSPVKTGPTLDVLPKVQFDGVTLQVTWAVCLTQFVGYDKPDKGREAEGPLPRFRVRQVANTNVLRDGQTLLVGCGTAEDKVAQKRGLFSSGPKTETKHVIVMLTPRIIDPAGNPLNSDKELGFE